MAHGQDEVGATIAQTLMAVLGHLDNEQARLYVDLAMSSLGEAARNALEALMQRGTYEYQSEFARKYFAQGLQQGREEGRQEGRKEGLHEGEQAALLEVLDARSLQVDAESHQRIMACQDLAQLKLWLRRAVTVKSVLELFEPDSAPGTPAP